MAAIKATETQSDLRTPTLRTRRPVVYPTGDGKPLGEDESHVRETLNCIQFLQFWFRHRPEVYVIGNNFVYWNEGVPKDRVSPDCYVVFDIPNRIRPSYKSWEEGGKLPDVVFEFTSRSTMRQDIDRKFALYRDVWKAKEYFLFDPNHEYLKPPLQGYRLIDGKYIPIELNDNRLYSEQLGLDLVMLGAYLRFYDPLQNEFILTLGEAADQAQRAQRQTENERAQLLQAQNARLLEAENRAESLKEENARMQSELDELRRQQRGEA